MPWSRDRSPVMIKTVDNNRLAKRQIGDDVRQSGAALRRWRWRWRLWRRQPGGATAAPALPASHEHSHAPKHQFSKSVVALNLDIHRIN